MGLDNPLHIAFLVVILLLVFGARRLPEIGRSLGGGLREFKQSINGEGHNHEHEPPTLPPAPTQTPAQAPTQTQNAAQDAFAQRDPAATHTDQR
jgi:sec-independent protein translocase protein TatA